MTSISQLRIVNNLTNNKNELSAKLKCHRINGTVRGRLGRMIPKNWKAVLASYPASCFGDIGLDASESFIHRAATDLQHSVWEYSRGLCRDI